MNHMKEGRDARLVEILIVECGSAAVICFHTILKDWNEISRVRRGSKNEIRNEEGPTSEFVGQRIFQSREKLKI